MTALVWLIVGAVALLAGPVGVASEDIAASAAERIERHRKADGVVRVLDGAGRAVAGAEVQIEQTRHRFLFGCNIFQWDKLPEPGLQEAYRERFAELFNYATLPFYWPSYEPRRGEPRHEENIRVARWCRDRGILTKGHPLAWNYSDPRWLPDDLDEIYRLQLARIDDCVERFSGLIDRWDVVNEPTHFDRPDLVERRAPKHSAMWAKVGRIEFTRACFERARAGAPSAVLLINDYRTDPAYAEVIGQLTDDAGKPMYDAVGIQSHMHRGAWSNEKIWEVCERFARFGAPLHFTEVTLLSGEQDWERRPPWPTTPEGEAWQAREAVRFYTMLFSHPSVEAITWWDFCDFYAWQRAPAGFLRRDMTPKPVYRELLKLVKEEWWTRTSARTDLGGEATFRGFLGDYRVNVVVDGKAAEGAFTLDRRDGEPWVVRVRQPES